MKLTNITNRQECFECDQPASHKISLKYGNLNVCDECLSKLHLLTRPTLYAGNLATLRQAQDAVKDPPSA